MSKQIITITDNAAKYISSIIQQGQQKNKAYIGLRIGIEKGGFRGNKYDFQYTNTKHEHDKEVVDKGVKLFIDPAATIQIIGSQMDYEDGMISSGFVFNNPNELGRCGCGKSVQL
ncbi:MAG: iron-sulfur cluster assembly accessory protein [Rickettsiales bacterium]|jgi:iron-sulfur cluster assembly accessory protein|nr:iron-sulfur cluster assembly accessory protein [Rickettsiales bacterium]